MFLACLINLQLTWHLKRLRFRIQERAILEREKQLVRKEKDKIKEAKDRIKEKGNGAFDNITNFYNLLLKTFYRHNIT